ncbi:hypothetical protein BJ508DRAFT_206584, partial [Ascobolus immersus RN42]
LTQDQYPLLTEGVALESRLGPMGFIPGEVFVDMRACYYAGIHNRSTYGICGTKETGAYSIVCSGDGTFYHDKDFGDVLEYYGTRGDEDITPSTQILQASRWTGNPVRVLRGASRSGPSWSQWAPAYGVRYDGLYRVEKAVDIHKDDDPSQPVVNCLFTLRRLPDAEQVCGVSLEAIRRRPGSLNFFRGTVSSGQKWIGKEVDE